MRESVAATPEAWQRRARAPPYRLEVIGGVVLHSSRRVAHRPTAHANRVEYPLLHHIILMVHGRTGLAGERSHPSHEDKSQGTGHPQD